MLTIATSRRPGAGNLCLRKDRELAGRWRPAWGKLALRAGLLGLLPAVLGLAGCGGILSAAVSSGNSSDGRFSITPSASNIDTNGTVQFTASLTAGGAASVNWSVPQPAATYGSISSSGLYTPPSYLTADSVKVPVTASLATNGGVTASATITVTPGFLQPLTPENVALGSGGTVTITGFIAEAGGTAGIHYAVASTANGTEGGQGSLNSPQCVRNGQAFTYCTVTYTAPTAVSSTAAAYIVATVGATSSRESSVVLLNAEGVDSSPSNHQQQAATPIALGSSGGNNNDFDTSGGNIVDCCSGTLGSLIEGSNGTEYLLSNNHVLARSDQASVGETIVQPGLIEDNCTPYPTGAVTDVGTLTGWVPIKSAASDVDAAIAQANPGVVNPDGSILELGARQENGRLAAAPPGVSSTGGKGESASIGMMVAKSGRTTGLTCASVAAVSLNVQVSYYSNCAETDPYYTKTYTNQIGIEGNQFSDAGDSGSLVVDTSTAEPVGLFFAGGQATSGVVEGVASPAAEVLSELGTYVGNGSTSYTFVGTTDHAVSCLSYGDGTTAAAQARALTGAEVDRTEQAMMEARSLVNPNAGILGVATGKSSDRAGEGTVIVYVDAKMNAQVPPTVDGVRTEVIPATIPAVATGTAPQSLLQAGALPALPATALQAAIAVKRQIAGALMQQNPSFFGVGVGQSLDNPKDAALVIYVDRNQVPAQLPATIAGLRTRYIVMERLHVTRAYLSATPVRSHCMPHPAPAEWDGLGLLNSKRLRGLDLY